MGFAHSDDDDNGDGHGHGEWFDSMVSLPQLQRYLSVIHSLYAGGTWFTRIVLTHMQY